MELSPENIRKLAKLTLSVRPDSITCEEWIHHVGEYVEATRRGVPLTDELRIVEQHASDCAECMDELDALRALVEEPREGGG